MRQRKTYSGPFRVNPQPSFDFTGELIIDLFAGGGNSVSPYVAAAVVRANAQVQRVEVAA